MWAKATVCCHDNGEHSSEARRRVDVDNGAPSLSMLSGGGDLGAGICRGYREGDVPPRGVERLGQPTGVGVSKAIYASGATKEMPKSYTGGYQG